MRAAPAPSPGRVTLLAGHIDFAIAALHHHHEGEDALLYARLIERVPEQAAMTEQVCPFLIERPWRKYASTLRAGT